MRDTKGHQVGGNGDAKYSGETRAGRGGGGGGGRPPSRRPVSIQTGLIVRDSDHTSRSIDLTASRSNKPNEESHKMSLKISLSI